MSNVALRGATYNITFGVPLGGTETLQAPNSASSYTWTFPAVSGTVLTTGSLTYTATPADPTGTASTTAIMMGLAGSFTPNTSTRILVIVSGQMANTTINDGATVDLRYGTGTAPANGAAVTGTLKGKAQTMTSLVAAQRSGFCLTSVITGLTVGTAYWIDLSLMAVTGGTANVYGLTITVIEI